MFYFIQQGSLQQVVIDNKSCRQAGSPVVVCIPADLEKRLTKDTVTVRHCLSFDLFINRNVFIWIIKA